MHNLPRPQAAEMFRRLTLFDGALTDLLAWVCSFPETLVVLNHPYWNESGAPAERHEAALYGLLAAHKRRIHALELNGLRPWGENRRTRELARALAMPVVSGGDRHGAEPNACLNLTRASSFAEFAGEVRGGRSEVWFRDHYWRPHRLRVIRAIGEILREYPDHSFGWTRWSDRVFYRCQDDRVRSLAEIWGHGGPWIVRRFVELMQLA
ncbi:MAG: hypothetical protein IT162_16870 [Bryobacterales bacterium]|nr:hypothetical protein [Bryobacterales bacterium]